MDYPNKERRSWEVENKRMEKIGGMKKKKASPQALRRKQRDQEEVVSVCACMIVFVRKREREEEQVRVALMLCCLSCGDMSVKL